MNGNSSKQPTPPPLPLLRHFPQRGQREGRGAPPPAGAARETRLPKGGAGRPNGLTEGVWFVEWKQLKATDDTPFAAARHETEV